jgi:hypothetical protein
MSHDVETKLRVHVSDGGVLTEHPSTELPSVEILSDDWREYLDHLDKCAEWEEWVKELQKKQNARPKLSLRRHRAKQGECTFCDREIAAGNYHHPSHDANPRCESGKHNHCTCDLCF